MFYCSPFSNKLRTIWDTEGIVEYSIISLSNEHLQWIITIRVETVSETNNCTKALTWLMKWVKRSCSIQLHFWNHSLELPLFKSIIYSWTWDTFWCSCANFTAVCLGECLQVHALSREAITLYFNVSQTGVTKESFSCSRAFLQTWDVNNFPNLLFAHISF